MQPLEILQYSDFGLYLALASIFAVKLTVQLYECMFVEVASEWLNVSSAASSGDRE